MEKNFIFLKRGFRLKLLIRIANPAIIEISNKGIYIGGNTTFSTKKSELIIIPIDKLINNEGMIIKNPS